jgi:hypothetical protein
MKLNFRVVQVVEESFIKTRKYRLESEEVKKKTLFWRIE